MSTIQVMMADDHNLVREGVRAILEKEEDIVVIGEADNGRCLINEIRDGARPNVVLVDIRMPGMSGIETTKRVRQLLPDTLVIGLSAVDEDALISEILHAGACTYVNKNSVARDLIGQIRKAFWANNHVHRDLKAVEGLGDDHEDTDKSNDNIDILTRRERDVMQMLMRGLSNKEIARNLFISERTVQTHFSNIFSNLNVNSRTEAMMLALRRGWLYLPR